MTLTPEEAKEQKRKYQQEYRKRPGVVEHLNKWQKAYQKEYLKRPEVKEHRQEYYSRPEIIEREKKRIKEYQKEYLKRPEVKERRREYFRKYYSKSEVIGKRANRLCAINIKEHHELLKHDPERLTTEFLINITKCKCKRRNNYGV